MTIWVRALGVDSLESIPGLLKILQIRPQFFFLPLELIPYLPCRQIQARPLPATLRVRERESVMSVLVGVGGQKYLAWYSLHIPVSILVSLLPAYVYRKMERARVVI